MRDQMIAAGLWKADDPRDPSVSIEAAWEVVEKLKHNDGWQATIYSYAGGHGYAIELGCCAYGNALTLIPHKTVSAKSSDSLPLAICLTALKAVGVSV